MYNDMPFDYLGEFNGDEIKLNDCFGFIEAIIETPKELKTPLLLHRVKDKVLHPQGTWKATYFSEELKAVAKCGYKITIVKAYQFTRCNLFKDYIDHFYEKKKNATGAERWIAKLHLNTLYGMFGRKLNTLKTIPIYDDNDFWEASNKYEMKNFIQVTDELKLLLVHNNLDWDVIRMLKTDLAFEDYIQNHKTVKSNVAIASAITSYARIEMMKYKTLPNINVYYTDTDSIFTDKPLPDHLVGKDIGLMKDELDGGYIKEAYFLGIKKYAFIDNQNKLNQFSREYLIMI